MAKWQSVTLVDNGTISSIASTAAGGITTITGGLEFVSTLAEKAKDVISAGPEKVLATFATQVANELIALLNDYKELGFYALIVDPINDNYGAKPQSTRGLEMITDADGFIMFKTIRVQNIDSPFNGLQFHPNEAYIKSMKLDELKNFTSYNVGYGPKSSKDDSYRDRRGRTVGEKGFVPPIPHLVNPPRYVIGGYDPATWKGELQVFDPYPSLPADKVLRIMSESFDDKGDIPKYQLVNPAEPISKGPFTESGAPIATFDPYADYSMHLYRSANTQIETSKRGQITKQIRSGKPNYEGNTELTGLKVSALAIVVGAPSFQDFIDHLTGLSDFLGGPLPDLKKILKALEKMFTPDPITVTVEVNTTFGEFRKGMYIKGFDSGCVGKIEEIVKETPTVRKRKEYEFKYDEFGDLASINIVEKDSNNPVVYKDVELKYVPQDILSMNFSPTEMICEAEQKFRTNANNEQVPFYRIKGMEYKDNILGPYFAEGSFVDDSQLPSYGFMKKVDAIAPNSVEPDFFSIKAAQIPGWSDFFDGLIELAEGLKGFAEDASAFLQTLIDAIDDIIEYLEDLAAKLIAFLEFFTKGLPSAGVYLLPITTTGGNKKIQEALTTSGDAPGPQLTYSAGVLLMGVEVGGVDPLVTFFNKVLGLNFQSV